MARMNLGGKRNYEPMWFCTRQYGQWIPAPSYNPDISLVNWNAKTQFLNGGAAIRASSTGHREYQFSWPASEQEAIDAIEAFSANVYGRAPFYFVDAFAAQRNLFPPYWSAPGMAEDDAPYLTTEVAPTFLDTPPNPYRMPVRTAQYVLTRDSDYHLYIPIPQDPRGMTLWIGADGPNGFSGGGLGTDTAKVYVKPFRADGSADDPQEVLIINVNFGIRYTKTFDSSSYTGVEVYLGGPGTIQLTALNAQILPTGKEPVNATSHWIIGQGHSGCEFEQKPTKNGYSSALDLVTYSAKLTEIGAWL